MSAEAKDGPQVARVDQVIDENGYAISLPEDSSLHVTRDVEAQIGATAQTNWWQLALIGIAIVTVILLGFQLLASDTTAPVIVQPDSVTTPTQ